MSVKILIADDHPLFRAAMCHALNSIDHISLVETSTFPDTLNCLSSNNDIDILIISTSHDEYKNSERFIQRLINKESMMIYDTVGIFSENEIKKLSKKHKIKVLGRGDL